MPKKKAPPPEHPNRAENLPAGDAENAELFKVTYTCRICGRVFTQYRNQFGSLPRICSGCKGRANAERVERWRERHPDRAQAANKRTVEQRKAKKAAPKDQQQPLPLPPETGAPPVDDRSK